jgi:hypothetical protein
MGKPDAMHAHVVGVTPDIGDHQQGLRHREKV